METLRSWLKWVYSEKQTFRRLPISVADRQKYLSPMTISCCICGDSITLSERVIHHCHLSGKKFGVAHSSCNIKARSTSYLPIFFHNRSHYDAHHIIKNLTLLSGEKLSAISRTDETYISFSVSVPVGSYYTKNHKNATITNNLRFLDSFQSMSQSLDSLAKTLKTDDFSLLKTFFSSTHPTVDWKLNIRKGHFPYSYLDSFTKFEKPLPNYGDDWKNTLTGKINISEADVAQAFKIYTLFGCRKLGDYHDVYSRTEVLILADVFEKFRQVCMKVYKLDPVQQDSYQFARPFRRVFQLFFAFLEYCGTSKSWLVSGFLDHYLFGYSQLSIPNPVCFSNLRKQLWVGFFFVFFIWSRVEFWGAVTGMLRKCPS